MEKIHREHSKRKQGKGSVFLKSVAFTLLGFLIIVLGYFAVGFLL